MHSFYIYLYRSYIADCGPPSPPPSGYILPYASTTDGAVVNFACQKSALNLPEENFTAAICSDQGRWNPDPAEFCTIPASGIDTSDCNRCIDRNGAIAVHIILHGISHSFQ